ncbi:MAG: CCA tRNA nucleotidyltransferase, partial [Candidatus Melainabacteria bacterium]|nr:CCA tRNA nucleotidyltransferase [Candidatus Melainabacteria bacterium]
MTIKDKLQKIDKDHFQLLIDIGDVAKKENLKAYLVGGMARDLLLGFDNLDIDITVENNSLTLADALVKAFPNCKLSAKHDRFHTAKLIFNVNGKLIPVDLASTREETYKHPAALPDVKVSELKKDLIRRDFTINALAVSLLPDNFGEVVDLFGGLNDLKNKKIKILHDKSFIDDPTRMIRAVRFAEKLDFDIEEKTQNL